jgi:hypothetical protein
MSETCFPLTPYAIIPTNVHGGVLEGGFMAQGQDNESRPLLAHFEVRLPKTMTEEELQASVTGTGPRSTGTGIPPNEDTNADVDLDT